MYPFPMFKEKYHEAVNYAAVPDELLHNYSGRVPDKILRLWEEDGFAGYMDGFLWTVNPSEYEEIVKVWSEFDDTHVEGIPIMRTAFGDLILIQPYDENDAIVRIINLKKQDSDILTFNLDEFFEEYLLNLEKMRDSAHYDNEFFELKESMGPISDGDCYVIHDFSKNYNLSGKIGIKEYVSVMTDKFKALREEEQFNTVWVSRSEGSCGNAGWEYGLPPGIQEDQWPRSREWGVPLFHGFTMKIPVKYRSRDNQFVAFSYFHPGPIPEDVLVSRTNRLKVKAFFDGKGVAQEDMKHSFWQGLERHLMADNPYTVYFQDELGHTHALLWHTEESFEGELCNFPDVQLPGGYDVCYMEERLPSPRALNYGKKGDLHFGWPLKPASDLTRDDLKAMGFGSFVLEIESNFGGVNYGDGNCQIDLKNNILFWSC